MSDTRPELVRRFDYLARHGSLRHPRRGDYAWTGKNSPPVKLQGRRYRQACRAWRRALS